MTEAVRIFHNPRCSKSRETLALIQEKGIEPEIVKYLENPPTEEELDRILNLLKLKPRELMRTKEPEYKTLGLDNVDLTEAELITAMVANPKLIERPIVLRGQKAALGRPPENVLALLD